VNYQFGSGKIQVRPYTSAGVPGSPIDLAVLQEASLDFKFTTKKLYGAYRFPVAVADGEGEMPLTCKSAAFYGNAFNLVLNNGGATTVGGALQRSAIFDEVGAPAAGVYAVVNGAYLANTVVVWLTPAGGGVTRQLAMVAAASEVAGVSCSEKTPGTGQIGFATGDNGATIRVSYIYQLTSGPGGQTITIANPLQNTSLGAQVVLTNQSLNRANNKPSTVILTLNECILPGLKLDFKGGDFTIPDYTMEVCADQNNAIGTMYLYNYDVGT
jgi:hypothetical protein